MWYLARMSANDPISNRDAGPEPIVTGRRPADGTMSAVRVPAGAAASSRTRSMGDVGTAAFTTTAT